MKNAEAKTKYVVLVGDGMADYPLEELGGKTPLQAADTPNMDRIASCRVGLVRTIPDGMEPGSDVANLSLLGYDPREYHTRRAPFEAASMQVELKPDEVAFRMNLVTLDFNSDHDTVMVSHSSGDLPSEDACQIVDDLKKEFKFPGTAIHQGVGYRHLLVWQNGPEEAATIPPHDVLGQNMAPYLNETADNRVQRLIRGSWPILKNHPVNRRRREQKEKEANSIWLWGQGRAPRLPRFVDKYGVKGAVICAVDLLRGMGIYAGFEPIYVKGATGYLNTNYRGKAEAVRAGLREAFARGHDYVGWWDADLATPLAEIARFVAALEAAPEREIVLGARIRMLGREIERSALRHAAGRVFAAAAAQALGLPVYDTQCGAKLLRGTPALAALFEEPFASGWVFDVELLARLIRERRRQGGRPAAEALLEVPLLAWHDVPGSKVRPSDFVRGLLELLRIRRRYLAGD